MLNGAMEGILIFKFTGFLPHLYSLLHVPTQISQKDHMKGYSGRKERQQATQPLLENKYHPALEQQCTQISQHMYTQQCVMFQLSTHLITTKIYQVPFHDYLQQTKPDYHNVCTKELMIIKQEGVTEKYMHNPPPFSGNSTMETSTSVLNNMSTELLVHYRNHC